MPNCIWTANMRYFFAARKRAIVSRLLNVRIGRPTIPRMMSQSGRPLPARPSLGGREVRPCGPAGRAWKPPVSAPLHTAGFRDHRSAAIQRLLHRAGRSVWSQSESRPAALEIKACQRSELCPFFSLSGCPFGLNKLAPLCRSSPAPLRRSVTRRTASSASGWNCPIWSIPSVEGCNNRILVQ